MRRLFIATAVIAASFACAYAVVRLRFPVLTITFLTGAVFLTSVWFVAGLASHAPTPGRRIAAWIAVLVATIPIFIVAAGVSSRLVNDWRLSVFTAQLLAAPPPGAEVTLRRAQVGVLTGNGNHCDFIVDMVVRGKVEPQEVLRHYESLPVRRAIPGEVSEVHVEVVPAPSGEVILTVTDAPNDAALDLRCT